MPSTLAHYGIQGGIGRFLFRGVDTRWILLGCLIPDIPWTLQRCLRVILPGIDFYDLRLYAIVQASLFFCLLLSAALGLLALRFGKVFCVLAFSSLFHLLLDACQTKWANGVNLLAPFSWNYQHFELFWPESAPTMLLTVIGGLYCIWEWRRPRRIGEAVFSNSRMRLLLALVLLALYFLLPFAFLSAAEAGGNHFVETLRDRSRRPGRMVEFDRCRVFTHAGKSTLSTFTGETLRLIGIIEENSLTASVRGEFVDEETILVHDLHVHFSGTRDIASCIGIAFFAIICARSRLARARDKLLSPWPLSGRDGSRPAPPLDSNKAE